ncbi:non-ribosomal peptide synthetase, partial [Shewanella sp.]
DDLPILPITLINTVPSVLLEVLKYQSITPDIRVINLAGEPLPSSLAATIFKQSGRVRIFNLYGPSEDTTYSTCYPVERDNYERMLIGSPLPGTQVLICDTKGRPLPDYFTGELYLAGKGLAKGYWNKPELSHEKFVHIPQLGTCYKTGDLVRRIENQQLAYVGRIDDQVKLRGFRIELGEIDNLIQMDPRVAESCTLLIESDGFKQIVSFIVCSISVFELDDIRQILATKLPQYMVPSYLHMIEKMPTTPSGKLDKKALKALCQVQGEEDATNWHKYSSYVKWCYEQYRELFPLTSFKVDDDFFGLGGNSLLAVTLVNRVRSKFGIEIRIKDLFLFSNAIKLGSVIEEQLKKQSTTMDEEIVF